jgi:hypothetical protein
MTVDKELAKEKTEVDEERKTISTAFKDVVEAQIFVNHTIKFVEDWDDEVGAFKLDGKTYRESLWDLLKTEKKITKVQLEAHLEKYLTAIDEIEA